MHQASTRMMSVETMLFMPSMRLLIHSENDISFRGTYITSVVTSATKHANSSAFGAEVAPRITVMSLLLLLALRPMENMKYTASTTITKMGNSKSHMVPFSL